MDTPEKNDCICNKYHQFVLLNMLEITKSEKLIYKFLLALILASEVYFSYYREEKYMFKVLV